MKTRTLRCAARLPVRAAVALMLASLLVLVALAFGACGSTSADSSGSPPLDTSLAPSPVQSATPLPAGHDMIAFTRGTISGASSGNMIDSLGIYVVRSDGTGLRRLLDDSGAGHPVWSPDGSKIAYDSGDGVSVMNADGSSVRQVATEVKGWGGLAWSPDGRQIVFSDSVAPNMSTLVVVNADGSGRRDVTAAGRGGPAWSPEGRILFIRESQVCSVNPDGSGLTVVTHGPVGSFSLSPDGKWLAICDGEGRLVRLAADGQGRQTVLISDVSRFGPPKAFFGVASSWSPDGKKIAFAGDQGAWLAPSALYVINADGSALRRVPNVGMGFNVAWRPQPSP